MVISTSMPGTDRTPEPVDDGRASRTVRPSALGRGRGGVRASVLRPATWSCPNCRCETREPRKRCADCGTSRY